MPPMHAGQVAVAEHPARFKVLSAGRRWRKSSLGVTLCLATALERGTAWWVAPSYPMASIGWRMLKGLASQIPGMDKREGDRLITAPTGGTVQVRSADNPDSLRGEGLDLAALDECAFMREEAWTEALRPALSDKKGRALFLSTPKGRNWFWRVYQLGQDPEQREWASWQLPTSSNPHIDPKEIEAARRGLPERIFLQEYMSEFIEDAGLVFRRVMDAATACAVERLADPKNYASNLRRDVEPCVFGVDWGKHNDFTVITVMHTQNREMLFMDRFNQIDYRFQVERLKTLYERYRPGQIIAEQNSMGEPLIEQLSRDGLPVVPFQTTNASKSLAIEALALAFERGEIKVLNDPVLIGELQAYEAERLPSGLMRYGAPQGMHDDCVMSLALAWHAIDHGGLQVFL